MSSTRTTVIPKEERKRRVLEQEQQQETSGKDSVAIDSNKRARLSDTSEPSGSGSGSADDNNNNNDDDDNLTSEDHFVAPLKVIRDLDYSTWVPPTIPCPSGSGLPFREDPQDIGEAIRCIFNPETGYRQLPNPNRIATATGATTASTADLKFHFIDLPWPILKELILILHARESKSSLVNLGLTCKIMKQSIHEKDIYERFIAKHSMDQDQLVGIDRCRTALIKEMIFISPPQQRCTYIRHGRATPKLACSSSLFTLPTDPTNTSKGLAIDFYTDSHILTPSATLESSYITSLFLDFSTPGLDVQKIVDSFESATLVLERVESVVVKVQGYEVVDATRVAVAMAMAFAPNVRLVDIWIVDPIIGSEKVSVLDHVKPLSKLGFLGELHFQIRGIEVPESTFDDAGLVQTTIRSKSKQIGITEKSLIELGHLGRSAVDLECLMVEVSLATPIDLESEVNNAMCVGISVWGETEVMEEDEVKEDHDGNDKLFLKGDEVNLLHVDLFPCFTLAGDMNEVLEDCIMRTVFKPDPMEG